MNTDVFHVMDMPMDNQMQVLIGEAVGSMAQQMESEFKAALDATAPGWTLDDVRRRCSTVIFQGDPIERFCLDGVPLLEIHPMKHQAERMDTGIRIRYFRDIRRLYSVPPQGVNDK